MLDSFAPWGDSSWTLSPGECLAYLMSTSTGRLGLSMGALPVIVPVHYLVVDDGLLFRTEVGSKVDKAVLDTVVAFQCDDTHSTPGDDGSSVRWSVLVQGTVKDATDRYDDRAHERLGQLSGSHSDVDARLCRLDLERLDGRCTFTADEARQRV